MGASKTSECSWYFVIYSIDCTLGTALVIVSHEACLRLAGACIPAVEQHEGIGTDLEVLSLNLNSNSNGPGALSRRGSICGESGKRYQWVFEYIAECGEYGDPPNFLKWAVQVRRQSSL